MAIFKNLPEQFQDNDDSWDKILDEFDSGEADSWDGEGDYYTCPHGIYKGYCGSECSKCDAEEEQHGGIDKCLNCGGYKWNDQLNSDQVCIKGCRNSNEY